MKETISNLDKARQNYHPVLPKSLENGAAVEAIHGSKTESVADKDKIKILFPKSYGHPTIEFKHTSNKVYPAINIGVVLSGGQAPGGHNVIAGIFDGVKSLNKNSKLYGFVGGPSGLTDNKFIEITEELLKDYRNTGGFNIIGSGRTKLEKHEQFETAAKNCLKLNIKAIVIVGGDDSNTNACLLAEYYMSKNIPIQVIGCPKTIDGDLKNEQIETSFGFDTACKVYSELIGNIQKDALSATKYWHFIKLMGRSASHIALECALQTHPNITLIGEEIAAKNLTLSEIIDNISKIVCHRSEKGKNYGVALIPEGLIEFIPEIKVLISELNELMAKEHHTFNSFENQSDKIDFLLGKLSPASAKVWLTLPHGIRTQLILDRDPHGNVQVSRIETERLLIEMVELKLKELKSEGKFSGKFNALNHFFGYEGRCANPSNFDANYCYSLGYTASALVSVGVSGYMSCIKNLSKNTKEWIAGGIPITMMMNVERRHGEDKPVIQKALVEIDGNPFKTLVQNRDNWSTEDHYIYPGPIQYFGPSEVCDEISQTLKLEQS